MSSFQKIANHVNRSCYS